MNIKPYILFFIIILTFLSSCYDSPMNVDTPRKIFELPTTDLKIHPSMQDMVIKIDGVKKDYLIKIASAEIDTTSEIPIIWMQLSLESDEIYNNGNNKLSILGIVINIDSLPVNFGQLMLNCQSSIGSYTKYTILQEMNSIIDTTGIQNHKKNSSVISFVMDNETKEIEVNLSSNIYEYRITDNIHKVDSSTVNAVIKFNY